MMQLTETEEAIQRVNKVSQFLNRVILYTYDAILLDVQNDELHLMDKVAEILSEGGFPVRQYRGTNYDNLLLHKI